MFMTDNQKPSKLTKLNDTLKARFDLADPDDPEQLEQVLDSAIKDLAEALQEPGTKDRISTFITNMVEAEKPYTDKANAIASQIRQDLLQTFPWLGTRDVLHSTCVHEGKDRIVEMYIQTPDKDIFTIDRWLKEKGTFDRDDIRVTFAIGPEAIPWWIRDMLREAQSTPKPGPG